MHLAKRNLFMALVLVSFFLVPLVGAASDSLSVTEASIYKAPDDAKKLAEEGDLFSELAINAELYNEYSDEVPGLLKRFVGSEEIAVKIELENGEMLYATLVMRSGMVGDFYSYDTSKDPNLKLGPSMTVETDEETVRDILDSDDPYEEAVDSMNDESLSVECKGLFKKSVLWTIRHLP